VRKNGRRPPVCARNNAQSRFHSGSPSQCHGDERHHPWDRKRLRQALRRFARNFRALVFQPSDPEPDALLSVAAWIKGTGVTNVRAPVALDVVFSLAVRIGRRGRPHQHGPHFTLEATQGSLSRASGSGSEDWKTRAGSFPSALGRSGRRERMIVSGGLGECALARGGQKHFWPEKQRPSEWLSAGLHIQAIDVSHRCADRGHATAHTSQF
jgi:hypothetical protein